MDSHDHQLAARPAMRRASSAVVLLLAVAGAGVDAAVLLAFDVLTAAQTGNTVLLGVALARGRFEVGLSAGVSVAGFVVGVAVGAGALRRWSTGSSRMGGFERTLLVELGLLALLLAVWLAAHPAPAGGIGHVIVLLAAAAMGLQSAAVLHLHTRSTTTYVTGMLATFTAGLVSARTPAPAAESADDGAGAGATLGGLTWLAYASGAVIGGVVFVHAGPWALVLPMVALAGALVVARGRLTATRGDWAGGSGGRPRTG